jgi:hypothetical protein
MSILLRDLSAWFIQLFLVFLFQLNRSAAAAAAAAASRLQSGVNRPPPVKDASPPSPNTGNDQIESELVRKMAQRHLNHC